MISFPAEFLSKYCGIYPPGSTAFNQNFLPANEDSYQKLETGDQRDGSVGQSPRPTSLGVGLIPGTHTEVEEQTGSTELSSDFHTRAVTCISTPCQVISKK